MPFSIAMRIEHEIKLDYNDVLIRPKRSTLVHEKKLTLQEDIVLETTSKRQMNYRPIWISISKHWRGIILLWQVIWTA